MSLSVGADLFQPRLSLGGLGGRGVGQQRQDLGPELDQARLGSVLRLFGGRVETVDELEHAIAQGRIRRRLPEAGERRDRRSTSTASKQQSPTLEQPDQGFSFRARSHIRVSVCGNRGSS